MSWVPDADLLQPGLAALGGGDLEPLVPKQDPEGIEDARFVVDHEHRRLVGHAASSAMILAGRKIVKAVPDPGPDSTSTRPAVRLPPPAERWRGPDRCRRACPTRRDRTGGPGCRPGCRGRRPGPAAGRRARRLVPCGISAPCTGSHAHRDADGPTRRLDRVEHQVGDDAVEEVLVPVEHGAPAVHGDRGVGPAVRVGPDQPHHRDHHRVQVQRHQPGGAHPREVEELAQEPAQPVALPDDEAREEPLVLVGVPGAGELLDRAPDRGQRVPDLVRREALSAATASSRSARAGAPAPP